MRKVSFILTLCLMLSLTAHAETPRIILFTAYEQQGWGDRVQAEFVDEDGGVWELNGYASNMRWPSDAEQQAWYLSGANDATQVGTLFHDDVFAIKSLIASAEDQGNSLRPGLYNDYGVSRSYAVRYDPEGEMTCILLGAYGDLAFSNTDPNAQALYATLISLSSDEVSDDDIMNYIGLQPIPLSTFCGYDLAALNDAKLSATYVDCEAGPIPVELSEEETQRIRQLAQNGSVTLKANALDVTGGYTVYSFSDEEDNLIADITLYEGLLISRSDGMYHLNEEP